MGETTIQWTDKTWNPVTGCTKVSAGCKNCYAERVFPRAYSACKSCGHPASAHVLANPQECLLECECREYVQRKFTDVQTHPDRLDQPLRWRKPQRVFVNSMSDLFHEDVPDHFIDKVFGVMALCRGDWGWHQFGRDYAAENAPRVPRHTFQILTKRPARMREYLSVQNRFERIVEASYDFVNMDDGYDYDWEWPIEHVWLGVSCEDQKTADERIPLLLQTPAAVRFVSYEPALNAVDFRRWLTVTAQRDRMLDWVIVGGESGHGARPFSIKWARWTIEQCKAANVPVFVKQLGSKPVWDFPNLANHEVAPLKDRKGGNMSEWPEDLRVREFPR